MVQMFSLPMLRCELSFLWQLHTDASNKKACAISSGTTVDGKLLEPGSFVDLKDGEEVDFGDGKRYIIRYGGARVFLVCSYWCQLLHWMKAAAVCYHSQAIMKVSACR